MAGDITLFGSCCILATVRCDNMYSCYHDNRVRRHYVKILFVCFDIVYSFIHRLQPVWTTSQARSSSIAIWQRVTSWCVPTTKSKSPIWKLYATLTCPLTTDHLTTDKCSPSGKLTHLSYELPLNHSSCFYSSFIPLIILILLRNGCFE